MLALDGLDLLLAATAVPVQDVLDLVSELRGHVHSTIISAIADSPLLQVYPSSTPLEIAHAALIMNLAHQAKTVMSVRELDTGGARDVSGVLRITRGGGAWKEQGGQDGGEVKECLYLVGGDGGVKVFERGA